MLRAIILLAMASLSTYGQVFTKFGTALQTRAGATVASQPSQVYSVTLNFHGDSITRDLERDNYTFGVYNTVSNYLGSSSIRFNQRGINGISYNYAWGPDPYDETMIVDGPIMVDTQIKTGATNWLVVFAGTNGILVAGHTPAVEYANFKTYIAARIAGGWAANRIVVVTMLPRATLTDSLRQTFNASLVGDDGGYGYLLARVDQNSDIGEAGDDQNLTYYYDGTHPTAAGHAIIASIVTAAMYPGSVVSTERITEEGLVRITEESLTRIIE